MQQDALRVVLLIAVLNPGALGSAKAHLCAGK